MQSISNLINWFILIWVKNNRMYKYHNTFLKTFNDKKGKLYCLKVWNIYSSVGLEYRHDSPPSSQ